MQSYINDTQNNFGLLANYYMMAEIAMIQQAAKFYWTEFEHMNQVYGQDMSSNQFKTKFEPVGKCMCPRDDFLIEGNTNDSPVSNWISNESFSDVATLQEQILSSLADKYCAWEVNDIQNENETNSNANGWWNELSAELNRETANWGCSTDEMDAGFLFPKARKDSMVGTGWNSQDLSRDTRHDSSIDKIHKIFNVWRVPKVAFKMISRWDLARRHENVDEEDVEEVDEEPCDAFEKRKAAFGTKRDDLFYKTIGRDVRKYLQEQFQCSLSGRNLKESLRNGTFLKDAKQFFNKEFNSTTIKGLNLEKVFSCVATLISYQGYTPYCEQINCEFSLKIHDSLHNFTKAKLIDLWKLPEFKVVFKYYSKKISADGFNRFLYHRTMKSNVKGYKYAFNDILRQWE